ncbi:hypothetical protein [Neisseria chenwenguii]|uniref:hypothetical protein n=1 Tax=Neisseria chenwenguii TaxID=1853278 RepID=UPI000F505D7E|nr:hypothetical protein [Neisseria chenwenguii]ROV57279.1 hypothetical protein EGS38_00920 [Neisseria chenwenguii]
MPALLIKDYLQTQGLKLPADNVRAAYLAAQAVMNLGSASIERGILWPEHGGWRLADHVAADAANEALLRQIFMALDSAYSRTANVRSAALYAQMLSENGAKLVQLTRQGEMLEPLLDVNDDNSRVYLACRTAQSGWLNLADDVPYWLDLGEIEGSRNEGGKSQLSAPVCTESGAVLGVLHVEFNDKKQTDEVAQTEWVALALALSEPLKTLLGIEEEIQND